MTQKSKRVREIAKLVGEQKVFSLADAIAILKRSPPVKFDQSVDVSIHLGIDPKRSDQQVRGTVSLPNGTGKSLRVLVFASGEKTQEALHAGANFAGGEELLAKVREGWTDFDAVIATPDMMREVGKLGKVLGPRGLMPTPKAGTVTNDIATAVKEVKGGKIEFKLDRHAVCNLAIGKLSFSETALIENFRTLVQAIFRAKPAAAKGQYFVGVTLSSTMGAGLTVDARELPTS